MTTSTSLNEKRQQRARSMIAVSAKIAREHLERERDLQNQKHFDYRFMSPFAATRLFAEEYEKFYLGYFEDVIEDEPAPKKQPIRKWASDARSFVNMWKARQKADAMGLPYDFFISQTISFLLRGGWQNPKRLPQPNQLMAGKFANECAEELAGKWAEWRPRDRRLSELPQYKTEHFRNLPSQVAHREAVIDVARSIGGNTLGLGAFCYRRRLVSEEFAIERLGNYGGFHLEDIRRDGASQTPDPQVTLADEDLWPSCFMVPHAYNAASPECSDCPLSHQCGKAQEIVLSAIKAKHGGPEPVHEKTKAQQRDRTRRFRERKRMAAAKPSLDPGTGKGADA